MSRLRRPFVYDRYILVTVNLLKLRTRLQEADYQRLARCLAKMREKHGFLLTAWVFLPDHWHAIIYPRVATTLYCMSLPPGISESEAAWSLRLKHRLNPDRVIDKYANQCNSKV